MTKRGKASCAAVVRLLVSSTRSNQGDSKAAVRTRTRIGGLIVQTEERLSLSGPPRGAEQKRPLAFVFCVCAVVD